MGRGGGKKKEKKEGGWLLCETVCCRQRGTESVSSCCVCGESVAQSRSTHSRKPKLITVECVTKWMGDRYVQGFEFALRFLRSQILCRFYKSPLDKTINRGNIQGDGRKFLGHFRHYGSQVSIIKINQTGSYLTDKAT